MIKLESDVRSMIKNLVGVPRVMTVEAAKGGTDGYPDFTIMHRGLFHLCELKRGEYFMDRGNMGPAALRVHLRPGQKQVIRQCAEQRIHVHVIGGEIGTDKLWYSRGVDCIAPTGITLLRKRFNTLGMLEMFFETPFDEAIK